MPATHRMQTTPRTAATPWLLATCLLLGHVAPLQAQAFGEIQKPPIQEMQASPQESTDSTIVGYTLYTHPDGTVMYLPRREIDIGRGTARLLDMQRSEPGQRARPIDGEHARRSYARYLKSFETDIPAHYKSGMDTNTRN